MRPKKSVFPLFLASSFASVCLGCQFGQTSFQVLLAVPIGKRHQKTIHMFQFFGNLSCFFCFWTEKRERVALIRFFHLIQDSAHFSSNSDKKNQGFNDVFELGKSHLTNHGPEIHLYLCFDPMVLTKISQHEASSTSKLTDHDIRQVPALSTRHHYKTKHFEIWKLMLYRCY